MGRIVEVAVPDIGEFRDVEVVELIAAPGERVEREASLISIESDKATLEIPSPHTGVLRELTVALGDRVSQGDVIARLELDEAEAAPEPPAARAAAARPAAAPSPAPAQGARASAAAPEAEAAGFTPSGRHAEVVVIGGGPGGYNAAFRAADLGKQVVLVEREARLGGVCLNVGCIPSKALLYLAERIVEAHELREAGVDFGEPRLDLERIRAHAQRSVDTLVKGLEGLARRRRVEVIRGTARFAAPDQLVIEGESGAQTLSFGDCVIAAGSRPVQIPGIPTDDPRVMDSTDALRLDEIPRRLLIIGGGIIGLEMATVYAALGSQITVVELLDGLIPGCDRDLVKPLEQVLRERYENIFLGTRVLRVEPVEGGLRALLEGPHAPASDVFDRVLVAVGRRPNADALDAGKAGVELDARGFIPVDAQLRTQVPHVYAIGDITGAPLLAHKASHQGKVAAEVIAGRRAAFDARTVPSVAYTDPEVAWMGLTEDQARVDGTRFEKAVFPWSASGRALGTGSARGLTKLLVDPDTRRVLGAGMVGRGAGELIAEAVLALEMGADAEDLALSIHPHPTLSETLGFAAEMVQGTITDLYAPRRK
jgi:dihydrolipoamide dehydrogenase